VDRFEEIQAFVKVVDAGSISGAAERLQVAKSAVSRRLSELEGRLGAQLLRRTTRRLSLTETGRSFYERCVGILGDLEEAELAVSQEHGALRGRLRVAVPLSFGLAHLSTVICGYARAHPDVEFDLDFNDRRVDLLQEGIDVAVRIARLADSTLIARRLCPIHYVICASPEYLDRHGTPKTPDDLSSHRALVYSHDPDSGNWQYRRPDGSEGQVKLSVHLRANNGDFLRDAAIGSQGIIREPSFIVYRAIEAGELIPLLGDYEWSRLDAYAVYPQTRHLSRRVRAFVDALVERFTGTPYWDRCLQPHGIQTRSNS
jgi:DNA-binding transcriptional LysR family regulator